MSSDESKLLPERCCATCAASYVIEPPKVAAGSTVALPPDLKPQRVCRLNPPTSIHFNQQTRDRRGNVMETPSIGLVQQATTDDTVCWSWKNPGTLPGD